MKTNFESALNFTMRFEVGNWFDANDAETRQGLCATQAQRRKTGYVDDPLDNGGETKFGIAANSNPGINIKTLTWDAAKRIYQRKYWFAGGCEKLNTRFSIAHFDACVNHGVSRGVILLQRAVGTPDDGDFGPATMRAVNRFVGTSRELVAPRRKFFMDIVHNKPLQGRFLRGWLRRVSELETYLG